ncbi:MULTISPECIES: TetR/AcrR family transcriptional regulator [Streptomyces]|uniref:TetR/AcrR family transcriptional regulator n=1 Tax=Streptomyces solicathayae TaxID=3081768 RepID=A0ABZ0M0K0_9ACTN|nr:TetR/AcrR family transcriptional regulator [Streptomyces sp. HUAS YS2]WOX25283.1 TetR/AcrR family transcriptional regulator [Streptomyces sp. HUAS YS2]
MDPVPQPTSPRRPAAQPAPQPLRRAPVQQRSAERLARILDACAELLDETGYEQLSTRAVAQRAGVPIGSVYRFFSNKRAMAAALAHRNLDSYAERITARLVARPPATPYDAIDTVLDEYIAMKRTVPGFARVDFGVPAPGEAGGDEPGHVVPDDPNHMVADRICDLLAAHLGRSADATLRRQVLVGVEATDALLQLAFRADPSGDPALIAETRNLLHAYLGPVLDRPAPAALPSPDAG